MPKKNTKGAEAVISFVDFASIPAVKKERLAKKYRPEVLDARIRGSRTKVEARLIHKAKLAGVPCPHVLEVLPYSITMTLENGKMLNRLKGVGADVWKKAGSYLAKLHNARIVHGDYTPANLMERKNGGLAVIDFGLGEISADSEDYAIDVVTMKKALADAGARKAFLEGYAAQEREMGKAKSVLRLVEEIENRGRYQERGE